MVKRISLKFSFLFFTAVSAFSQSYPSISYLDVRDVLFVQLEQEILQVYSGKSSPDLAFFSHTLKENTNIFSIASAIGLPVETIATLNRIPGSGTVKKGTTILLVNIPGIFISVKPNNNLEHLIYSRGDLNLSVFTKYGIYHPQKTFTAYFLPHSRFNPVELGFFLGIYFHFPVDSRRITSYFGIRNSIKDGSKEFHHGIDIGVSIGSDVYAARSGKVIKTGCSEVYGNYIIIEHDNEYQTLYGHLREIYVKKNQKVSSGEIIALSGNTGFTSGPHLHFEVRKNGKRQNPSDVFPGQL